MPCLCDSRSEIRDPTLATLPKAYVVDVSERLKSTLLSHVGADRSICYLDKEVSSIFPFPPEGVIRGCIMLVEEIVASWIRGDPGADVPAEFSSYWDSNANVYRLAEGSSAEFWSVTRRRRDKQVTEFVISDDKRQVKDWLGRRHGESAKPFSGPALLIDMRKSFHVPMSYSWPPKSMRDLCKWLDEVDPGALRYLVKALVGTVEKDHTSFFVELRHESESIALQAFIDPALRTAFLRAGGASSKRRKDRNKKSGGFPSSLLTALSSPLMTRSFHRYHVEDTRASFIFTRNQPNNTSLSGLKIALIGCGTIGGYAAHTLIQCGAGTQGGEFDFYDPDVLRTGNLGRHLLGVDYLGDNKAEALADFLIRQTMYVSLRPMSSRFREDNFNAKYDLIIDATGHEPFSILLSNWYRSKYPSTVSKRPILLHGWIDGKGTVARVLRDDGSAACYTCLSRFSASEERLPVSKRKEDLGNPYRRSCGSTYLPYPSQVSLAVAGLLQQMALSLSESINFRQREFHVDARRHPDKHLNSTHGCPVCNP